MPFRVALIGIYHESNTFIDRPTTLDDFRNGHWLSGQEIINEYRGSFHEIGGMINAMERSDLELVPIMFAEATPGGIITEECYRVLLDTMMQELQKQLPVDACLVVPHGAGVAEGYDDMDGHWLDTLRNTVGNLIPIIGTLDPHANVSRRMTDATTALIAYKTNPHIDQYETGRSAAELLIRVLDKEIFPVQHLIQSQVAISIEQQNTAVRPCRILHEISREITERTGLLSISVLLGFPYADVKDMGSSFIIVSNYDAGAEGRAAGDELNAALIALKNECIGEMKGIESILPGIEKMARPVLLLDMGDNIGGGSPGDSTYLLNAIESDTEFRSFHCIVDRAAVRSASNFNPGDRFELKFGDGMKTGSQSSYQVTLIDKADGKFTESRPRHGGQVNFDMGPVVIVVTGRGSTVMISSLRVPPFSLKQITTFGIRPEQFDILVAKGVNAPVAAYNEVCPTIIQVNTPGVTQADMTLFHYAKRRRPLFPFEEIS